ncbi:Dsba-like thioredoxin domain protein [Plakobranchus ocellatus]|uniref:Dsba-like thioredoxin domain protein n=1 Tax=Plakobranchus ocellatus TaxID=259542 RepID=A0AAV4DMH9_9GAST|nr:Dsba-like thioredoxin domain protein [Plakobranchus ocellatus]
MATDVSEGRTSATDLPVPEPAVHKPKVHILVVSDVVCPWCWIAKRRLESAMESLREKLEFDVQFSPFLLRPKCPREGAPNPDYKKHSLRTNHLREIGDALDLDINFSCPILPDSVPALTLRQYVRDSDYPNVVQSQLVEKLYEAYFTKGLPLTRENLLEIARELMLDVDQVKSYLDEPQNERNVIEQAESWRNQGVQAVPFFFMNGKAACSGAQDEGDFVKTILKVAEKFPEEQMELAGDA